MWVLCIFLLHLTKLLVCAIRLNFSIFTVRPDVDLIYFEPSCTLADLSTMAFNFAYIPGQVWFSVLCFHVFVLAITIVSIRPNPSLTPLDSGVVAHVLFM